MNFLYLLTCGGELMLIRLDFYWCLLIEIIMFFTIKYDSACRIVTSGKVTINAALSDIQ